MARTPLVVLTLLCLSGGLRAQVQLHARMDAAQVVPPSLSQATGEGEFTLSLDTRRLTYRVLTTCVAPLPTLRIALAPRGVSGGTLIDALYFGYYDMWENTTRVLTDAEIGTFLSEGAYVQIESSSFGTGEIRGQITPQSRDLLQAQLSGSEAVPATSSTATGSLRLAISRPDNMVFYDLSTSGINGLAAILHQGAVGQTGSAIMALTGSFFWWRGQSGPHSDAEIAAIKSGDSYVTIYTTAHPNGEIRGQIAPALTIDFTARLDGRQVSPPTGSLATGFGSFSMDTATRALDYDITITGIVPTSIEIDAGFLGQQNLTTYVVGTNVSSCQGTTIPFPEVAYEVLLRQGIHVVARSPQFPGGEIRGQLIPNPLPYGLNGSSATDRVRILAWGEHRLGSPDWTVGVSGVPPSTPCWMVLSLANESFLGAPLPLDLGVGQGLDRSYLWIDITGAPLFQRVSDVAGTASVSLPIPNLPALRGMPVFYQWAVFSGNTNANFSVSDALRGVIQ